MGFKHPWNEFVIMNAKMDPVFDAIDIRYLLLENYKQLGFTEADVMVILVIDHLTKQDNRLMTTELLSLKMSLPLEQIDQIMVKLLQRQLLAYTTVDGNTFTSLQPLKQLLYKRFQQHVLHQTQEINLKEQASIFQTIEQAFGRTLSPLEISRIQDWLNFGYTPELITQCLKEAISKQKKSIRMIDKLLQKETVKENFSSEGFTGGQQDIQKTLSTLNQQLDDESKDAK
jgi:DNA replication protein